MKVYWTTTNTIIVLTLLPFLTLLPHNSSLYCYYCSNSSGIFDNLFFSPSLDWIDKMLWILSMFFLFWTFCKTIYLQTIFFLFIFEKLFFFSTNQTCERGLFGESGLPKYNFNEWAFSYGEGRNMGELGLVLPPRRYDLYY